MALKGTATIELTNADGSREIYKHDNLVTNAPSDLCKSLRGDYATILKNMANGESYIQALFGGILLFSEALDDSKTKYDIPSGKVVGYASQDAYAGLDVARGSFNEPESGVQDDGKSYKFVWDFSTAQANGSIASLALCPNLMGKLGLSASAVKSEAKDYRQTNSLSAPFDSGGHMLSSSSGAQTQGVSNYNYILVAIENDIGYAINLDNIKAVSGATDSVVKNGGILKLYRFRLGAQSVGVSCRAGRAAYLDCKDVQMPSEFVSALYSNYNYYLVDFNYIPESNKLIVFPKYFKGNVASNAQIQYVEISLNDLSVTSKIFTNTTGGYIPRDGGEGPRGAKLYFYVGRAYTLVTSVNTDGVRHLFATKNSDNTNVKMLTLPDGTEYALGTNDGFQVMYQSDNTCAIYFNDNNYNTWVMFVDFVNGTISKTNAKQMSAYNNVSYSEKSVGVATGNYLTCNPIMNPFVLCTKNNLESAVTKTASQTMKITYTLTESEGA